MFTVISEFLQDMKAQKLRTTLTLFGIIWGTIAIIVLLAVGEGFKKQTMKNMHGMGAQVAVVFDGRTTKAFGGFGISRDISLLDSDAGLLKNKIPELETATAEYTTNGVLVRHGDNAMKPGITGVEEIYGDLRSVYSDGTGRWVNRLDIEQRRRVAFIGDLAKKTLFGDADPIGKTILVGDSPFTVIGVMKHKNQDSNYGTRDEDRIFIPISTYKSLFNATYVNVLLYRAKDSRLAEYVESRVREVLAAKYTFDPKDEGAIGIWDTVEMDKFFYYFFLGLNIFLGVLGVFTLAVGGIGVANIMFIVVQERIKEIGIRRAMGATKTSIMIQFMGETFFIVGSGAFIGFVLGVGFLKILSLLPIEEVTGKPELSLPVAFISIGILMFIGLVAGMLPARKAANLDVVECLRT